MEQEQEEQEQEEQEQEQQQEQEEQGEALEEEEEHGMEQDGNTEDDVASAPVCNGSTVANWLLLLIGFILWLL